MKFKCLNLLIAAIWSLSSCTDESITREFHDTQTLHIDVEEHDLMEQEFGYFDVSKAPDFLGGLRPKAEFAYTFALCENEIYCRDSEWSNGGMICGCKNIVIKRAEGFRTISSRSEFKEIFAPITTRGEALSYAIAMSGHYPVFDNEYFKNEYRYFNGKPNTTAVQEFEDYYLVQLFDYTTFGCEHPYYTVLVRVYKNGDVSEQGRRISFEDPADDALCID